MGAIGVLLFLIGLAFLASPVLTFLAWRRVGRLEQRIARLEGSVPATAPLAPPPEQAPPERPNARQRPAPDHDLPEAPLAHRGPDEERRADDEQGDPITGDPAPGTDDGGDVEAANDAGDAGSGNQPDRGRWAAMEQSLTDRWMVWLGGVTVALGGVFLIKYGVEHGLLSPVARVAFGLLFGLALLAGGEWLRRHPGAAGRLSERDDIPAAASAAGILTLYGSVYGGYVLYDLLAALPVFVLLATVSAAALLLSLLHGPFLAALGLIGAYAVPLLVPGDTETPWPLFLYLLCVGTAGAAVDRMRLWGWISWFNLAAVLGWGSLWLTRFWTPGDGLALGTLIAGFLAGLFWAHGSAPRTTTPTAASRPWYRPALLEIDATLSGAWILLALLCWTVLRGPLDPVLLSFTVLLSAGVLFAALRLPDRPLLALPVLTAACSVMLGWQVAQVQQEIARAGSLIEAWDAYAPIDEIYRRRYLVTGLAFAGLFTAAGYLGLMRHVRAILWCALAVAAPLIFFCILYWRLGDVAGAPVWVMIALALAAGALAVAAWIARRRNRAPMEHALGLHALAVCSFLALALTIALEDSWLTLALAAEVTLLAWTGARFRLPACHKFAGGLAAIVLVRLATAGFAPGWYFVADPGPLAILILFAGVALAFAVAARLLRGDDHPRLAAALNLAAFIILVALISLEVRYALNAGRLAGGAPGLAELSLHLIAWSIAALILLRATHRQPSAWLERAWRLLAALSGALLLGGLLVRNPLLAAIPIDGPIPFDTIALAYGLPAGIALLFRHEALRQQRRRLGTVAGSIATVLLFVWASLEVRHAFHGDLLNGPGVSEAELYSYSAVWLLLAIGILGLGILRHAAALRGVGLLLLTAVVAKVFLLDMAGLTGLYRVFSFIALGLSLIGVGWIYRRFVYRHP